MVLDGSAMFKQDGSKASIPRPSGFQQSKEDKQMRWKYTLLILDNMLDSILSPSHFSYTSPKFDIDFVKIAENLPKMKVEGASQVKTPGKGVVKGGDKVGLKVQ